MLELLRGYVYIPAPAYHFMEEEEYSASAANSEIRFITLELMKLAQKSGRSFEDVANEYLKNGEKLQEMLQRSGEIPPLAGRRSASRQK
jgi:hypothetical protein